MSDRNISKHLEALLENGNRHDANHIPDSSGTGIYALFLKDGSRLDGIRVDPSGLLYIGMTQDTLEARNHFQHEDSSFSSPRRSLGAILKRKLGLVAVARGSGRSQKDMTNYRFADDGKRN